MLTDVLKTHRLCICVLFCRSINIVKFIYFVFRSFKRQIFTIILVKNL